jgi:uncharacterized membrane protein YecN with MAPEG domain
MRLPVTALYGAILALLLTALAINVTVHRAKTGVPLGPGDNPLMLRMMRLHGNAAEYVPISLLLMALYELDGGGHVLLHVIGVTLVVARVLHAWGLARSTAPNFGRGVGQTLTWAVIVVLAILNLRQVL